MSDTNDPVVTATKPRREDTLELNIVKLADTPAVHSETVVETPEARQQIDSIKSTINITDSQTILAFGVEAQKNVTSVSEQMLEGVRNKDTGPVGASLVSMVTAIRGLDFDDIKPGEKQGFFSKLMGKVTPVARFIQQYEDVQTQLDTIQNDLDEHRRVLIRDVVMLDKLYTSMLEYFHNLDLYIAAGDERLAEIDRTDLPEAKLAATTSNDMLATQRLQDLQQARDSLERKVHDLRLTRQVTLQGLPSIRIVQQNDKGLIEKIQSQILNTLPMWKQQLAVAVTIWRSAEAAKATKAASDLQNELLTRNAETLQSGNAMIRTELERGVYDIESIKAANEKLIQTIQDGITIANEGRTKRMTAERDLEDAEHKLKQTLLSASA